MSSFTAIKTMLERLGFSDAAAAYLTGASGIDSLDEIRFLDGIDDIDSTIKGVTNPGGTVTTEEGTSRVALRNNVRRQPDKIGPPVAGLIMRELILLQPVLPNRLMKGMVF
jgi:hypothetical protein